MSPLLLLHVCAGAVGLLSGTVAICLRKGSRGHARVGIVFSVAMLTLAASGVYLAYTRSQPDNTLGGLLTFYMVATAWRTARQPENRTSLADWIAMTAALLVGTASIAYGLKVAHGQIHPHDGVPAGMDFFLGSVLLLAAAGDLRMLLRGGVAGPQGLARHLWRMCFALFIASGSFFMGRQQIFPAFIRHANILPALTVLPSR